MTSRAVLAGLLACTIFIASSGRVLAEPAEAGKDSRLEAARRHVEQSDRYLHHSHLARGMKGYGLTVLAGTEIVRFDVEILSVLTKWDLHQDVILARLSGQNLEKTGVIMGMSGSPVYVRHDGKDKLIGAVAYRFFAQTEPLCGIQPITQMLVLDAPDAEGRQPQPDAADAPPPAAHPAPAGYLACALAAGKLDLSQLGWPARPARGDGEPPAGPRLVPLTTPLMISGIGSRRMAKVCETFAPAGLLPVQAGGVSAAVEKAAAAAKLEPGAAISIPLVTGDADWYAVGTVTDVLDDRVLALGHSFFAEGEIDFPMGPAYVHAVVPGLLESFKLASTLKISGAVHRDETVGVAGRLGQAASMIPMTVSVEWKNDGRRESFRYRVCRHRWLTPVLVGSLIEQSARTWRDLPERHTVRHSVRIDFARLGSYRAADVSSGTDVFAVVADGLRPLAAILRNPFEQPPDVQRIDVSIVIESGETSAGILQLELDGSVYRPGEAVTGKAVIRPFRKPRAALPVRFELPEDLPEGEYTLTVCDSASAVRFLQQEKPQRFDPRTVEQLFQALKDVVEPSAGRLYLRLPVTRGGLAVKQQELPDLPDSKARILAEAERLDSKQFSEALVRSVQTDYVLQGSASAGFRVQIHPQQTLMRQGRNPKQ